jgi:Na+-translocating ferredoxin:NAD+ oxidoreductase RnfD subunit
MSFVQNLTMNYLNSASGLLSCVIFDAVVPTKSSYLMMSTGVRFLDVDWNF